MAQITINDDMIRLLETLCNATAVSGDEREVRKLLREAVTPLADEVRVDALGNLLAVRHARNTENPLRVMLDAHMDEIGFMIVSDEENGLYRFVKVGGIDERTLPGKIVLVGKDKTPGVIGAKPIHLAEHGELENKISLDSLKIDLGPGGKAKVGDRATFATRFQQVGPSFIAKALDNRLGCATLVEILRFANETGALDHLELLFSWSVQEEIGLRGARVAAYALDPEVAVAIDSTPAYDLPVLFDPGEETRQYNTRLGAGPAIYLADSGTLGDPRLARHFMQTGADASIPYQIRQPGGGGTDAGSIHRVRGGVPALSISVPGRYAHTAATVSRRSDWEATLRLLSEGLIRLNRSIFDLERDETPKA